MPSFIDITGKRFGRLVVLKRAPNSRTKMTRWECLCDCGNKTIVHGAHLKRGAIKSCGCYTRELSRAMFTTHGETNTRLHRIWKAMRERCRYKRNIHYKTYGGRGITVCKEWDESFVAFRDWALKNGYADNLSIDRIDNNGNYTPENCRWATPKQQARNTTRTRLFNGRTLSEWAEILGIGRGVLSNRIYCRGWTVERALNEPVHKR